MVLKLKFTSLKIFKDHLLALVRSSTQQTFNINKLLRTKLSSRIRLDFRHFEEPKVKNALKNRRFLDTVDSHRYRRYRTKRQSDFHADKKPLLSKTSTTKPLYFMI